MDCGGLEYSSSSIYRRLNYKARGFGKLGWVGRPVASPLRVCLDVIVVNPLAILTEFKYIID